MKFVPYLSFNGNAEEAINFYADILGGEIQTIMRFNEAPASDDMPPIPEDYMDKVLHASLSVNGELLYLSDTFPGMDVTQGDQIEINIAYDSEDALRIAFDKLAAGGTVKMPVDTMFWNAVYGSLVDKFGIGWSLDYELPKE